MGRYKYRAANTENIKIEGTKEGNSKQEIMDFIASNGYYPLLVEEVSESKDINLDVFSKVRLKDISIFCRQFYTMLDAGVPILTSLQILTNQTKNSKMKESLSEIQNDVERGETLSSSMKKQEKVFPRLLINLIEAGEAGGNLDTVLLRMSNYYEKENKTNNKVKNAMIYPIILSFVAIVAVIFILVYVMPTFKDIFEQTGTSIPWYTKIIISVGDIFKNSALKIFGFIAVLLIGTKYYFSTKNGQISKSKLALRVPIIKNMNMMLIVSRFTRTMSTLLSSGIPLIKSLDIVSRVVQNNIAEESLIKVRDSVSRGESLNSSMKKSELFPQMLYSMIKIGEESGSLEDILNKTADFYDEELDSTIQATVSLMEPLLIVIMGLIVGFIILSVMIPMYDSYLMIGK